MASIRVEEREGKASSHRLIERAPFENRERCGSLSCGGTRIKSKGVPAPRLLHGKRRSRMRNIKHSTRITAMVISFLAVLLTSLHVSAQTETVLYNFGDGIAQGVGPFAGLISDAAGNLYGTTINGGYYDEGTVFELRPAVGGGWTQHILHTFGGTEDGTYPYAGLVLDAFGNLYGATIYGAPTRRVRFSS